MQQVPEAQHGRDRDRRHRVFKDFLPRGVLHLRVAVRSSATPGGGGHLARHRAQEGARGASADAGLLEEIQRHDREELQMTKIHDEHDDCPAGGDDSHHGR